ncbi:MAG: DUF2147 domain-containing protein [Curvibacter sp.]|nr:DUF2147 domain-containing protein [Curvibacter sp.]
MIRTLLAAAALALALPAMAQMSPVGLWRNVDDQTGETKGEIRIEADAAGGGALHGVIAKVLKDDAKANCDACTDDRKGKPVLGLEIIRGAKKAEGQDLWEGGTILDPENGKTYRLTLRPQDGGSRLQVRGYIGPFYRTQVWIREP